MSHLRNSLDCSCFRTSLGWVGLVVSDGGVEALSFGHARRDRVQQRLANVLRVDSLPLTRSPEGPLLDFIEKLQRYAAGEQVDLSEIPTVDSDRTPFQQRVIRRLKRVGYGETMTYAELAASAGSPRAARAVGSVMARNRVPLIIPCHRVLAAGGRLGGFSAPHGLEMKQYLLRMEAGEPVEASFA